MRRFVGNSPQCVPPSPVQHPGRPRRHSRQTEAELGLRLPSVTHPRTKRPAGVQEHRCATPLCVQHFGDKAAVRTRGAHWTKGCRTGKRIPTHDDAKQQVVVGGGTQGAGLRSFELPAAERRWGPLGWDSPHNSLLEAARTATWPQQKARGWPSGRALHGRALRGKRGPATPTAACHGREIEEMRGPNRARLCGKVLVGGRIPPWEVGGSTPPPTTTHRVRGFPHSPACNGSIGV